MEPAAAKAGPSGLGRLNYLLDTDVCSALIKGERRVHTRAMQYLGRLHVSAISAAELYTWVHRENTSRARLSGLRDLLSDVVVLDVNQDVARRFGEIRAAQLDQGRPSPEP